MMARGRKSTPLIPYPLCPFPYHTKTIPQEAFAVQSIEISINSSSKAVSTLDLMSLTSTPVEVLGAIHLDTMYV